MRESRTLFLARFVSHGGHVDRVWPLTAYEIETVLDEISRGGARARVEFQVSRGADARHLRRVRAYLGRLAARGVEVRIRSEDGGHGVEGPGRPAA